MIHAYASSHILESLFRIDFFKKVSRVSHSWRRAALWGDAAFGCFETNANRSCENLRDLESDAALSSAAEMKRDVASGSEARSSAGRELKTLSTILTVNSVQAKREGGGFIPTIGSRTAAFETSGTSPRPRERLRSSTRKCDLESCGRLLAIRHTI